MFGTSLRPDRSALAIPLLFFIFLFLFIPLTGQPAQAQTFKVIYNFIGGAGGAHPYAGLTMDSAGNFYGTTFGDSFGVSGSVFHLSNYDSTWVLTPLYAFHGGSDGANPYAGLVIGNDGSLYGTTQEGGGSGCIYGDGCGTVFSVGPPPRPRPSILSGWNETVIYRFTAGGWMQGLVVAVGSLVFDHEGNLYGTSPTGGNGGYGFVYKLTPSNGGWTESEIYSFTGGDGADPYSGVIFDASGNLYGTTSGGGARGAGTVFQLSPSGSGWTETTLYNFQGGGYEGAYPFGGVTFDHSGNLYGTTTGWGVWGGGTVFELSPVGGGWTFTLLHSFADRAWAYAPPTVDAAGNVYGTTWHTGTYNDGMVYKLTPSATGWTFSSLHDFTGGSDGAWPISDVIWDASGNLYGTATSGGAYCLPSLGCGVVWEITP